MPRPQSGNYLAGTSGDETLDISAQTADYTVDARAGNDTIYGGGGHDSLYGGRGDDLIFASPDDMLIDGGPGVDTVSFANSGTGVQVGLSDGSLGPYPAGPIPAHVLKNIENVIGSDYRDILFGSRAVNELNGGDGNDRLQAYGSGDFLTGGAGADEFIPLGPFTHTVTITDFHYNEGDRFDMDGSPQFNWVQGSGVDADGNVQSAWIGTCNLVSGGTLEVIVLGYDTDPTVTNWFI